VGALEGVVGAAQGGVKCLKAACLFHLGDYEGAVAEALGAPESPLKNRTLYMSFKRLGNEAGAGGVAGKLSRDSKEDVMCLAALSFHEGRYQEALDEYKRLLSLHKEDMALNLYISLCCFKMDLYDLSLEALNSYLQAYPLSPAAINLKACNRFKLFNGKQAITELKVRGLKVLPRARVCVCVCVLNGLLFFLSRWWWWWWFFFFSHRPPACSPAPHPPTRPLTPTPPTQALEEENFSLASNENIRHNLVVFRDGDDAMRVLTSLLSTPLKQRFREPTLNLALFHFNSGRVTEASALVEDITPQSSYEMIVKANVAVTLGQQALLGKLTGLPASTLSATLSSLRGLNPREAIKVAKTLFEAVGTSPSDMDSIPGRQAMALAYFLRWQVRFCCCCCCCCYCC